MLLLLFLAKCMQEPVHGHQQTDEVTFNVRYPSHRNKPEIMTCLMHVLYAKSQNICDSNINTLRYADDTIITRDKLGATFMLCIINYLYPCIHRSLSSSVFIGHSPVDKLSIFDSSAVIGVVHAREPVCAPSTCQGPTLH